MCLKLFFGAHIGNFTRFSIIKVFNDLRCCVVVYQCSITNVMYTGDTFFLFGSRFVRSLCLRSSYNVHEILSTGLFDRKTMRGTVIRYV